MVEVWTPTPTGRMPADAGGVVADLVAAAELAEASGNRGSRPHSADARVARFDLLRRVLRCWGAVNAGRIGPLDPHLVARLRQLAHRAFDELGGDAEPPAFSLRDYDATVYGPYLGVSGEASAAPAITEAGRRSPKARVLGRAVADPERLGLAHDAERLGSVGELPVGRDEYRDIRLTCAGRLLSSTNVGGRVNVRYFRHRPVVWVNGGKPVEALTRAAERGARRAVAPFLHTPDGVPRPLTVQVRFRANVPDTDRVAVLRHLRDAFASGRFSDPAYHRIGLLAGVRSGPAGVEDAQRVVDLAVAAGVTDVAIEGRVRAAAEEAVSLPGIVTYFEPRRAERILRYAQARGIRLQPAHTVDTDTVARQVWAPLETARRMGFHIGKYGLFPLTLAESERSLATIQRYFPSWTAAPAFYVDLPLVLDDAVLTGPDVAGALRLQLDMAARHGVPVVLVDTLEKSRGRGLLRTAAGGADGYLSLDEVQALDAHARERGVRVLWAGGIGLAQALELGRLEVFGLYVTTAATRRVAVTPAHVADVALPAERVPTREGVERVKLLLEAGFLSQRCARWGREDESRAIDAAAARLLAAIDAAGAAGPGCGEEAGAAEGPEAAGPGTGERAEAVSEARTRSGSGHDGTVARCQGDLAELCVRAWRWHLELVDPDWSRYAGTV